MVSVLLSIQPQILYILQKHIREEFLIQVCPILNKAFARQPKNQHLFMKVLYREVGGGIGMGNTCKPMAVSFQCMTKSTTNKKKIKKREKKRIHIPLFMCSFNPLSSQEILKNEAFS